VDDLKFGRGHTLNRYDIHLTHYLEGLSRLNISNPESMMQNFAGLIQDMKNHPDYSPDLILIDSRSGFTESLGIFVLYVSDIIVGFFREDSQSRPGLHFLFEKVAGNEKFQQLVIVNAITSDLQRMRKFGEDIRLLAENFDTGEGAYPYDFAGVCENDILKNLSGDSRSHIELIARKQFHSYNQLFAILEKKIEVFRSRELLSSGVRMVK